MIIFQRRNTNVHDIFTVFWFFKHAKIAKSGHQKSASLKQTQPPPPDFIKLKTVCFLVPL